MANGFVNVVFLFDGIFKKRRCAFDGIMVNTIRKNIFEINQKISYLKNI